jgi:hypothetical protein
MRRDRTPLSLVTPCAVAAMLLAPGDLRGEPMQPAPRSPDLAPPAGAVPISGAAALEATAATPVRARTIAMAADLATRTEVVSAFPVDRDGQELTTAPGLMLQARLGVRAHAGADPRRARWLAEAELDLRGAPIAAELEGAGLPYERGGAVELRKAYLRVSLAPTVHLMAGAMINQWGLGLVANDGARAWSADDARFADPVSGDRVGRVAAVIGPLAPLGGTTVLLGGDYVLGDDVLLDDRAVQGVAALQVGRDAKVGGGLYVARRHQWTDDDYTLDAWAVDATVRAERRGATTVKLEAEAALVIGETSLAPSMDHPVQDVLQVGAALRGTLRRGKVGAVVDVLFASGDQNPYDDTQHGFHPDPNFEVGLLLYRVVLAGHSGRGSGNAGDPGLVGHPAEGVDRIATRGSATNTLAVFPRAVYRPTASTTVYGGPLVALSPEPLVDPFASRIGGDSLNALGGTAGRLLGVEADVGARHQRAIAGVAVTLGVEVGALFPGDAFTAADGDAMAPVYGGRFLLQAHR